MGILDTARAVSALTRDLGNAELKHQMLELREQIAELYDENLALREQNKELLEKLATRDALVLGGESYWKADGTGGFDGPFCTNCWDGEKTQMRLVETQHVFRDMMGSHTCPRCEKGCNANPPK